ncbi:MAG: hypothetical protein FJ038_13235 [Chloroflexi bacterium]|nr:hypothetical protein [Chloroflexota bacterium]
MFATLASGYTRLPREGETDHLGNARAAAARGDFDPRALRAIENTLIRELVAEQEAAGLELVTDGNVRWLDDIGSFVWALKGARVDAAGQPRFDGEPEWTRPVYVDAFRFLRSTTEQPVRIYLLGPYTLARASDPGPLSRERLTITLAEAISREVRALADAGCQVVQIDEPAAATITTDAERSLFRSAHRRLLSRIDGVHMMLSVLGGSALQAGARAIFDARYNSYLFDLRTAPQNWLLAAQAPGERGLIVGVAGMAARDEPDEAGRLRWAATLAAALHDRGPDRVGVAPAGSLDGLSREDARRRIETLAETALDLFAAGRAGTLATDVPGLVQEGLTRGWFGDVPGSAIEEARARELPGTDETEEMSPGRA